jgi:hypothetical protein
VVTKGVARLVWLMLELHHGDSHTLESRLDGQTSKEAKMCPNVQWVLLNGGGVPTSAPEGLG